MAAVLGVFQAQTRGRPAPSKTDRVPLASFSAPTRVTVPSSTSGWVSITSKIRSAPARAERRVVICWEIWFRGWPTCLE